MLEVKEQAHLSFKRMLDICIGSISYRLMRSAVTVVIIVLAIAFLAQIMMDGYLGRAARDTAQARREKLTAYSRFLSALSYVETDEKLIASFAHQQKNSTRFENADVEQLAAFSEKADLYLAFFNALPVGRRALLVEQQEGLGIFDWLSDQSHFEKFNSQLQHMKSLRLPRGSDDFRSFIEQWPAYRKKLEHIKQAQTKTIAKVNEFCGGKELSARLHEAIATGQTQQFFQHLAGLGFTVDERETSDIVRGLQYQERVQWAFAQLKAAPVRTGWNRQFQEEFSPGVALTTCASSKGRIDWIERTLKEAKLGGDFDAGKFRQIAIEYRDREKVLAAAQDLFSRYGTTVKLGERTVWLIVVSFLVCVVGIANAMLMSVLERFKEIATMKCLGARNQTIAFLFVTESIIIGLAGGIVGTLLGFLIVFVRQTISYGGLLWANIPYGDMGATFVACFCCSLLLAAIAAIYPAGVAARMAPMEAMRVD